MDLKQIVELAKNNELSGKLAEFTAAKSTEETLTAAFHQGRASVYAELTAILNGNVRFDE